MFLLVEALASSLLVSFFVIVLFKFGVSFMYRIYIVVVTVSLRKYFTQLMSQHLTLPTALLHTSLSIKSYIFPVISSHFNLEPHILSGLIIP